MGGGGDGDTMSALMAARAALLGLIYSRPDPIRIKSCLCLKSKRPRPAPVTRAGQLRWALAQRILIPPMSS